MPILDRLNGEPPSNGDHSVSPIIPGRSGRPSMSLEAIRELVERQFREETTHRADILAGLDTEEQRHLLLREVAEYVFATEALSLQPSEQAAILDKAYRNLFTLGPLDSILQDETVTEITINGPYDIHIRRGFGPLQPANTRFDDATHLQELLTRILAPTGAVPSASSPFSEVGMVLGGRPARLSIVAPPVSPVYTVEIRLHPSSPRLLSDLAAPPTTLSETGSSLLRAILTGGHGVLVVGDAATGKTTLAGALVDIIASTNARVIAVERAGELHLPPHVVRLGPVMPTDNTPGADFAGQINKALNDRPDWLVIDEIRGDEAPALWDALTRDDAPHYLWVFRGASQPDRLRSALGMVFRRSHPALEQSAINTALVHHLPFVVIMTRTTDAARLSMLAEWSLQNSELTLRPLLVAKGDGWVLTNHRPHCNLSLPPNFWD